MMKKLLKQVEEIIKPYPVYAVGGCVRDYILKIIPKDYDFCTSTTPEEIEKKIKESGRRAYLTGKRFGTIGCKIEVDGKYYMVEITTFRSEEYEAGNRKPKVSYVKSLSEDLSRRDFTINAMAIRLKKDRLKIIDLFNGREDLRNKIIKAVGNPKTRFKEDSLRILRAIRFSARFNFSIEEKTLDKIKKMAIHILDISKERWVQELDKILLCDNVGIGLKRLWEVGLFKYIIPEMQLQKDYKQNSQYHNYNLDTHIIKVVEAIRKDTDDLNLLWAGLLHDIAKPFLRTENKKGYSNYIGHEILGADMVKKISTHLKFSNERTKKITELVRNHLEDDCILRKYDNEGKK